MTDAKLAQLIAAALRHDYRDTPSPIKHIGLQTGVNLRAIKNWFQGRHAPSATHLLVLARISPGVLRIILEQTGKEEILRVFEVLHRSNVVQRNPPTNVSINVPIKSSAANHNQRQIWFMKHLRRGQKVSARHISAYAGISLKTARRDIAALIAQGIVRFIGAKKTGYYGLT
ncbi:MAG: HTH domain-containing protein [Proteobacteria bacterium]|nr:HTH domain-containing protein [Pseudomonadota bacterium]